MSEPVDFSALMRQRFYTFPLSQVSDIVLYIERDGNHHITWQTGASVFSRGNHVDIHISGKKLYLCSIELLPWHRGQGLGYKLYKLVETIARDFGCTEVEQTASGTTHTGESRAEYLRRKLGYTLNGDVAKKEIQDVLRTEGHS